MMDGNKMERVYKENLEERIMSYLMEREDISYEKSMEICYRSKMAKKIQQGREGIQYMEMFLEAKQISSSSLLISDVLKTLAVYAIYVPFAPFLIEM